VQQDEDREDSARNETTSYQRLRQLLHNNATLRVGLQGQKEQVSIRLVARHVQRSDRSEAQHIEYCRIMRTKKAMPSAAVDSKAILQLNANKGEQPKPGCRNKGTTEEISEH
jgi:hypothetical protein